MPWKETTSMNEKERFVMLAQTGRFTITDLCKDFGISRKTGHKYLHRYEHEDPEKGSFRNVLNRPDYQRSWSEAET